MATTPDLGIPYIASQQAQPEITHNEAVNQLQMLTNGVVDRGVNDPPSNPSEGDAYIVGAAPTGAWAGRANHIAGWFGTAWVFLPGLDSSGTPITMDGRQEGLAVWVRSEDAFYVWTGGAWQILETGGGGGGGSGGAAGPWEFIGKHDIAGAASYEIEDIGNANHEALLLVFLNVTASSDGAAIQIQVKKNGTTKTSGYDRVAAVARRTNATTSADFTVGANSNDGGIQLTRGVGGDRLSNVAASALNATCLVFGPHRTIPHYFTIDSVYLRDSNDAISRGIFGHTYGGTDATAPIESFTVFANTGTFSGTVLVYGLRASNPETGFWSKLPETVVTDGSPAPADYLVQPEDAGHALVANSGDPFTLDLEAAATLGEAFVCLVRNIGAGDLTIDPDGAEQINGSATLVLQQNDSAIIWCNGTEFRAIRVTSGGGGGGVDSVNGQTGTVTIPVRTILSSDTDFYVDPVGGSDGNSGLSPGAAKATLQAMLDVIHGQYDLAAFTATVNWLGGANCEESVTLHGPFTGARGPESVIITGPAASPPDPDDFHIVATGLGDGNGGAARSAGLRIHDGAALTIQNFSVTCTDGYGLMATRGGYIRAINWKFNDLLRSIPDGEGFEGAAFIAWEGGIIEVLGGGIIAGDMDTVFNAQHHGQLICNANDPVGGTTVEFAGTLDIATTIYARDLAAVRFPDTGGQSPIGGSWAFDTAGATLSYAGMRRYRIIQNAALQYILGADTTFPGNQPGAEESGGVYYTGAVRGGSGQIVQEVVVTDSTFDSTTSDSFQDTSLSASITPVFTNSIIEAVAYIQNITVLRVSGTPSSRRGDYRINNDTDATPGLEFRFGRVLVAASSEIAPSTGLGVAVTRFPIDSTAQRTFTLQFRVEPGNSGDLQIQTSNDKFFVLREIRQ